MSRTYRRPTKHNPGINGRRRDGSYYRYDRSCQNHGSCDYCQNNRVHKHRRAAPVDFAEVKTWELAV